MSIAQNLKTARIQKGLSQQATADTIKTSQRQISKYETGENDITATRLAELCLLYGVSADYVLDLPKGLDWPR